MGIRISQVERTVRKTVMLMVITMIGVVGIMKKRETRSVVQNMGNFDQQRLQSLYNLVVTIVQIY